TPPRHTPPLHDALPIFESQATTSPPSRSAIFTPSADFPEAVGPTMATRGKSVLLSLIERGDAARVQKERSAGIGRGEDYPESVRSEEHTSELQSRENLV